MAHNPRAENLAHFRRIFTGVFDFVGRSQRSEFIVYLFVMMAVAAAAFILTSFLVGPVRYSWYLQLLVWLPGIPIFVRRLHDQNRSGWLGLIMPVLLGMKAYEQAEFEAGRLPAPDFGFPISLFEIVLVIAFWLFVFWPGTDGDNRYGPDPRKDAPVPAI